MTQQDIPLTDKNQVASATQAANETVAQAETVSQTETVSQAKTAGQTETVSEAETAGEAETAAQAEETGQAKTADDEQALYEAAPVQEEELEASALALAQTRIAEYDDRYKRLFAEFENFRRRTAKERLEMVVQANSDLLRDLLPVVDDMDRALKVLEAAEDAALTESPFAEGIKLVRHKLHLALERKGLKPFAATGQPFDPDRHEAITQIPAPTDALKGCVVDEIEKGYNLGDKVLRFARVVVGI